jgi:hypothetical protein
MQGYTIWAYSPSLNQRHRRIDLANPGVVSDRLLAQRHADAFAGIYNRDKKGYATDWQGEIRLESLGIETIPGYRR